MPAATPEIVGANFKDLNIMNLIDVRREALSLAVKMLPGTPLPEVLTLADAFSDYILNGQCSAPAPFLDARSFISEISLSSFHGEWVPFRPYSHQIGCLDTIEANDVSVITQARQMGVTSFILAYMLWYTLANKSTTLLLHPRQSRATDSIMVLTSYIESLPPHIRPGIRSKSKSEIVFEAGGRINAQSATINNVRGKIVDALYIDEFSSISHRIAAELLPRLQSTCPSGKLIISTGVGHKNSPYETIRNPAFWSRKMVHMLLRYELHEKYSTAKAEEIVKWIGEDAYRHEYECAMRPAIITRTP